MSPVVRLTVRLGLGLGVAMTLGLGGMAAAQGTKAAPAPTEAAQKKTVAVVLTQAKVVKDARGKEQLLAADSVKPGDVLEYTATYTNHTGKAVTGLVANLPIPEGLEYLPKTAKPGATLVKAATKDGAFAAEPLARVVNGKSEPVPYNEYPLAALDAGPAARQRLGRGDRARQGRDGGAARAGGRWCRRAEGCAQHALSFPR
ncbi:hypothetical protein ACFJIS_31575 [Variovorax boronicumulans]|uniref:hypothetical protein n=1 Tax=Variovorax boronicumulans TaxID=436515 RepID=UPI0036F32C59